MLAPRCPFPHASRSRSAARVRRAGAPCRDILSPAHHDVNRVRGGIGLTRAHVPVPVPHHGPVGPHLLAHGDRAPLDHAHVPEVCLGGAPCLHVVGSQAAYPPSGGFGRRPVIASHPVCTGPGHGSVSANNRRDSKRSMSAPSFGHREKWCGRLPRNTFLSQCWNRDLPRKPLTHQIISISTCQRQF